MIAVLKYQDSDASSIFLSPEPDSEIVKDPESNTITGEYADWLDVCKNPDRYSVYAEFSELSIGKVALAYAEDEWLAESGSSFDKEYIVYVSLGGDESIIIYSDIEEHRSDTTITVTKK